jgi:PLP dependent protein
MSYVSENLKKVRADIVSACARSHRDTNSVELVAVSNNFSKLFIEEAILHGQTNFGESKLQESEIKINVLPQSLSWHFIGRVQRNKVRKIIRLFSVIHAVDSINLASYINIVSGDFESATQIFIQVNIANEKSKGGFSPHELRNNMETILKMSRLKILGLMCIPPIGVNSELSRSWFISLRHLRDDLESEFGILLPCLSMGMSNDFQVAIEEGATHVRVGNSIFGNRRY